MKRLTIGLALTFMLGTCGLFAAASAQGGAVTLFESKSYVAPSTSEDHFEDNISLKPGQENLPLTLVVRNGGAGKVPYNWFRLNIAGYLVASEKDLSGRTEGSIDVTGRIQPGGGQVLIDAAGEPGATLSFALVASPVALKSIQPEQVEPGQALVLHGAGFSSDEAQDSVVIGSTPVQILSASANSMTVLVPQNTPKGVTSVKVTVNGLSTRALPLQISSAAAPVLQSSNYWMAPPGAKLIISGKNFAPDAANNKVFFKNVQAKVLSATTTSLTVIVPNWGWGPQQINVPLYVESNGVRSANALPFDFSPKYQGNWPGFPGDSSSQATP